jgi:hypothetical protein
MHKGEELHLDGAGTKKAAARKSRRFSIAARTIVWGA